MSSTDSDPQSELVEELAELRVAFQHIAADNETMTWEQLSNWAGFHQLFAGHERSETAIKQIFEGVAGGSGTVNFQEFLQFLEFCEAQGNDAHLARLQEADAQPSHGADKIVTLLRRASVSALPSLKTVREALVKHFRGRVDRSELVSSGIYQLPGVQTLQFEMTKDTVKKQLSTRHSVKDLQAQGIQVHVSEEAHDLEKNLKRDQLKRQLEKRHSIDELNQLGIHKNVTPVQDAADKNFARVQVKRGLDRRQSLEELQHAGIYIESTARRISLERQIIKDHLNRTLSSDLRPQVDDLKLRGLYLAPTDGSISYTFTASALLGLERQIARARLSHALQETNRPNLQQLKDQGIYIDQSPLAHDLERSLSKDLLKKGLEQRSDVEDLQKKGIL